MIFLFIFVRKVLRETLPFLPFRIEIKINMQNLVELNGLYFVSDLDRPNGFLHTEEGSTLFAVSSPN